MNRGRIDSFKSAILNTVVRVVRPAFQGLTLLNCMDSDEFRSAAYQSLQLPLFTQEIEPAMGEARCELMYDIERR